MSDQADTLRRLMQKRGQHNCRAHVFTVASGKGGVGKSCFVANLGTLLARSGIRTLLVDADFGLASLDIMLNPRTAAPRVTLENVIEGRAKLQEVVIGVEPNLWLLPSSSGLSEIRHSNGVSRAQLTELFESCPWEMDVILVDAGAGIQENVLSLHDPSFHSVVILTPDPTSIADAYALIKLVQQRTGVAQVDIVVNQASGGMEGRQVFQKLKDVAGRFVSVQLDYLGHWERDEKITQSVMKRKILLDLDVGAPSLPSLELIAKRIKFSRLGMQEEEKVGRPLTSGRFREEPVQMAPGNSAGFWKTLLGEVKA